MLKICWFICWFSIQKFFTHVVMYILKGYFKIYSSSLQLLPPSKLNYLKYIQHITAKKKKKRKQCNEFTRLEIGFQLAGLASSAIYIMHNRAHHRISISSSSKEAGKRHRCIEKNARGLVFSPVLSLLSSWATAARRKVTTRAPKWKCMALQARELTPRSETSLKRDSHNSIRGGPGDERSRDVKLFSITFYESFLSPLYVIIVRWTYYRNLFSNIFFS